MALELHERLKLKQFQVDTWTTKEQLCLASAVMKSGDQNWVAVSRAIRLISTEVGRPPDWYSIKNCALQYAKLLERVDAPKRKRERGENSNETPGEIVNTMLSKLRVNELSKIIAEEQKEYNVLINEVEQLESGSQLDDRLDEMWNEMIREQEEKEEEEKQRQIFLKQRKEKLLAIQQALRTQGHKGFSGGSTIQRHGSFSENSSEVDSAVNSPDVEQMETSTAKTGSPVASSSLGFQGSNQSPAVRNLITTALEGIEPLSSKEIQSRSSSSPGSTTLSKLLESPSNVSGQSISNFNSISNSATQNSPLKNGTKSEDGEDSKSFLENKSTNSTSCAIKIKKDQTDDKSDVKMCKVEVKQEEETIFKKFNELADAGVECNDAALPIDSETKGFSKSSKPDFEAGVETKIKNETSNKEAKNDTAKQFERSSYTPSTSQNLSEILFDNLKRADDEKGQKFLDDDDFKGFEDNNPKKMDSLNFDDDISQSSSDTRDILDDDILPLNDTKSKTVTLSDMSGIDSPCVSESTPSSPASFHIGEDSEAEKLQRLWRNSIKIVWNEIASHKYASIFLKPIQEDKVPGYHSVVYRPMDLTKIKRNIEMGVIKNTSEFQRDLMLMFLNAKMYNPSDHNIYQLTTQMAQEAIETLEEFQNAQLLARASDSPVKTLRRETRESSSKKIDEEGKRKKDIDERQLKKRRTT